MRLLASIALRHLMVRKRQSLVSLMGIILGVGFFLAVASMMQGSERDFLRRLVDNSPHITVSDEFRLPRKQPVATAYPKGAVELRSVKPPSEIKGIRNYEQILSAIREDAGARASPVLTGQAIASFGGEDTSISLNGIIPDELDTVSNLRSHMVSGRIENLIANPNGILIGAQLARRMSISFNDNLTIAVPNGQVRVFKIVGIFKTGQEGYDRRQVFFNLKRAQALLDRPSRINSIIIKLTDPYDARDFSGRLESRIGYKSVSWQEASEDLMSTLKIRNIIMYSVVSAILVVASFGIYNVISTVVMEKSRDIAILKSMGFYESDIQWIFVIQGIILGVAGSVFGLALGSGFMLGLMRVKLKPPGVSEAVFIPMYWGWPQFAVAAAFAITAAVLAAFLPARKGARVQPVDILRGTF